MKYPNTSQNVAGRKLKKKHMIVPSHSGNYSHVSEPIGSSNFLIKYTPNDRAVPGNEIVILVIPHKCQNLAAPCGWFSSPDFCNVSASGTTLVSVGFIGCRPEGEFCESKGSHNW